MLKIIDRKDVPEVPKPDAAEIARRAEAAQRAQKLSNEDVPPSRRIRRFSSHREMEEEDIRYWSTKSMSEKIEETASLIRHAYGLMGIDVDAQGSNRTLVRVQRTWR